MKFTQEEANLLNELAKAPITVPASEALQIGAILKSALDKVAALTLSDVDDAKTENKRTR
jgi:hypothetical protein